MIADLRQQINELLYTSPLGPVSAPDKTATEAHIRYIENLESFSAMIPRLQTEFFDPVITRSVYLINQVMPENFASIPDEFRKQFISVDGQILDLKFETPLMTARGQIKTQALLSFYNALATMLGQEAGAASFKPAKLVQTLANNAGADLSVIHDEKAIDAQLNNAAQILNNQLQEEQLSNGQEVT